MRAVLIAIVLAAVAPSSAADPVAFRTALGCGDCFWELALAGDHDRLALLGRSGGLRLSADGGRTWAAGTLDGPRFLADPKLLLADGTLFLTALVARPHPQDASTVRAGGLFQGPIADTVLHATLFKDVPADLPTTTHVVADYPKLARDPVSGALFVSANAVRFADGSSGMALFTSTDGGAHFDEQRLDYQPADVTRVSPVMALDTTADGALRGLFVAGRDDDDRQYLLRFGAEGAGFAVVPGLAVRGLSLGIARVAGGETGGWLVYQGPELAIDRSATHPGRLYVAWAEPAEIVVDAAAQFGRYGRDFDVRLAWSDDDGETWSAPLRVNDDPPGADQVFPSLRVDDAGTVHVAFLDRRAAPEAAAFDVTYALVDDGRVSPNVRVDETAVPNPAGGRSVGDYLDMLVAFPDRAFVAYPCGAAAGGPADACVAGLDPRRVWPPTTTTTTTTTTTLVASTTTTSVIVATCAAAVGPCAEGRLGAVRCAVDELDALVQTSPEPLCRGACPRHLGQRIATLRRLVDGAGVAGCRGRLRRVGIQARRLRRRLGRLAATGPTRVACAIAAASRVASSADAVRAACPR